jgi:hypothetical protein
MTWNKMQALLGLKVQRPLEDDPDDIARTYGGAGVCGH